MDRTCRKCGKTKPIEAFHKHASSHGGHLQRCIACVTEGWRVKRKTDPAVLERERQYWAERPEQKREKNLRFKASHVEKNRQNARDWYAANRKRANEAARQYYADHREEKRDYDEKYKARQDPETLRGKKRAYYQQNRERILEQRRELRKRDPGTANRGSRMRRTRKRAIALLLGHHTEQQWQDKLAYFGGCCAFCDTTENITRDHIVPLAKGGSDLIGNIQPLCYSCNARKSAHLD